MSLQKDNSKPLKERFSNFISDLQNNICDAIENVDGNITFRADDWQREGGGGGHSRTIKNGHIFEKGGVNTSTVYGELPEQICQSFKVEQAWFWAAGISLIIHPRSPMIPAVHANFRYFELYDNEDMNQLKDCWFGGGADLTPYYLWDEDAVHFHQVFKKACDLHGHDLYPRFKKECDTYFYNHHRGEARGIGGLFFDYLRPNSTHTAQDWYAFTTDVFHAFMPAYLPIVDRRKDEPYTDEHRYFQEIRRGRYVEFNLTHDRGTRFGLQTGGRTESVLMSLPPRVRWDYDYRVEANSREAYLIDRLKNPIDWIDCEQELQRQ